MTIKTTIYANNGASNMVFTSHDIADERIMPHNAAVFVELNPGNPIDTDDRGILFDLNELKNAIMVFEILRGE